MTTEGNQGSIPASASDAGGAAPQSVDLQGVLRRLEAFEEKVSTWRTEFGRDLGKLREKRESGARPAPEGQPQSDQPSTQPPPPAGISREELDASRRLGFVQASLPKKASEHIDQMLSDGASYGEALRAAELIAMYGAPASGGLNEGARPSPPGHAAIAAPSTAPRFPTSISEFRKLLPEARAALRQHPDFDSSSLANR